MLILASFLDFDIWDNAPPEWYFLYVVCAYLGILLVYVLWKKYGGYDKPDKMDR